MRIWTRTAALAILLSGVWLVTSISAQTTPDPDDVAEGMRLYRTKGDCQ